MPSKIDVVSELADCEVTIIPLLDTYAILARLEITIEWDLGKSSSRVGVKFEVDGEEKESVA